MTFDNILKEWDKFLIWREEQIMKVKSSSQWLSFNGEINKLYDSMAPKQIERKIWIFNFSYTKNPDAFERTKILAKVMQLRAEQHTLLIGVPSATIENFLTAFLNNKSKSKGEKEKVV